MSSQPTPASASASRDNVGEPVGGEPATDTASWGWPAHTLRHPLRHHRHHRRRRLQRLWQHRRNTCPPAARHHTRHGACSVHPHLVTRGRLCLASLASNLLRHRRACIRAHLTRARLPGQVSINSTRISFLVDISISVTLDWRLFTSSMLTRARAPKRERSGHGGGHRHRSPTPESRMR